MGNQPSPAGSELSVAVTQGGTEGTLFDPNAMNEGDQHQADRADSADPVSHHQPHAGEDE